MLSVVNLFLTSLYNPPIVRAWSSTKKAKLNHSYFLLALNRAWSWWLLRQLGHWFPMLSTWIINLPSDWQRALNQSFTVRKLKNNLYVPWSSSGPGTWYGLTKLKLIFAMVGCPWVIVMNLMWFNRRDLIRRLTRYRSMSMLSNY